GWRSALFILAGVLALIVAPANLLFQRQRPEEMNLKPDFGQAAEVPVREVKAKSAAGPTLRAALRDWRFWGFALGVLTGAIPLHMVLIHQVAAISDAGFSKESAAWALGLIGLFTAPAMIGMGLLADRIGRPTAYALGSAAFMVGIFFLMAVNRVTSSWLFYAFPPFIAIGFSSRQSLYPTIAADLFHGKSFGAIIGALALFIGAGAGIGPWLGGLIFDWTGAYYWAFSVAQVMTVTSVVFIWLAGSRRTSQTFELSRSDQN
ncbi:MAG TPA: MFS transporter, partial [Candidatus Binatia bacterium]